MMWKPITRDEGGTPANVSAVDQLIHSILGGLHLRDGKSQNWGKKNALHLPLEEG